MIRSPSTIYGNESGQCIKSVIIRVHQWLHLIGNLGFDELRQQPQRFLPAKIAGLGWNDRRDTLLNDVQFRSAKHLPQRDRRLYFPRQVRVVESIGVTDEFVWFYLERL